MSIFASRKTDTIQIPHDPPHTVTIQALPGRTFHKAKQESMITSAVQFRRIGGAAFQKELKAIEADKQKPIEEVVEDAKMADPAMLYDAATVLEGGVKAWTYPDDVTPERLSDLDDDTSELLVNAILKLTKPSIFESKAAQEAERKNG